MHRILLSIQVFIVALQLLISLTSTIPTQSVYLSQKSYLIFKLLM
jgi:hypothetical protein